VKIAVVGLGKLGAPLAAVLASKGHEVTGIDHNRYFVDSINAGRAPVLEPQLQELMTASGDRLKATTSYESGIPGTEISFVIVPTPSNEHGVFSNKYVLAAVEQIGESLRGSHHYHVVNITSTVMPGSTGGEIRRTLEAASGRRVGMDLGLTYNPEFIALGSVVRNMLYPDMLLIGESDKRAGDSLEAVYRQVVDADVPMQRMNWINAEITKLSVNTYVTTKITFANMLSGLCERMPGADVDVVTRALGMDSRIGSKYLRGALGYGGPCFPRDNVAFSKLAAELGVRADIATATHELNIHQVAHLRDLVQRISPKGAIVAVLGMSYKPDTPVIEESQGVMIAAALGGSDRRVLIYDPLALDNAMAVLRDSVQRASTAVDAVAKADVIVIPTPWPEFKSIPRSAFERPAGKRVIIIDCWRLLSPEQVGPSADIIHLGVGGDESVDARLRLAVGGRSGALTALRGV
jgi:UDPglucose 6-dehydrogenase